MKRSILLVFVLSALVLSACGSRGPDSPPLVYMVKDGDLYDGFQGSYCWDQGVGAALCVDMIEPYFDETISLSASDPIRFQFDTPLPDEVTLSISEEVFGESLFSESVSPAELVDWSPTVPPGEYIVSVGARWKQGDVSYWFSVTLE